MTAVTRSPEPQRTQAAQASRRGRAQRIALGVVAIFAVGLGATLLYDRSEQAGSPSGPAAVDEAIEVFVQAMEANDLGRLQTVVTPAFRRAFYQSDADGSPWRDVWRLERYEFWDNPKAPLVDWQIARGDGAIVLGSGPWFVSEPQIWRNAAGGIQYEGIATFVLVESDGEVVIDDMYWAAQPGPLQLEAYKLAISGETRTDFVDWLAGRFLATGLDPPDAAVTWFPPSLDCPESGSFALRSEPLSGEPDSVTLCFDDPALLLGGDVDGRWTGTAVRYGLHELAHVWLYTHVGDEVRAAFVERAGLEVWRGERAWDELGVEHAAETIAWGVAGSDAARYDIEPEPSCAELTARFELLTGLPPLTSCTTSGG